MAIKKALQYDDPIGNRTMRRYKEMCIRRDGWRRVFALLSKYILMRPVWYGDTSVPWRTPQLSVLGVADDMTADVARTAATALGGMLWPSTPNTYELLPHMMLGKAAEADDVKKYFAKATHISHEKIDNHESCFNVSNPEHLEDQVIFGTSGIYGEEVKDDDHCPVRFHAVSVETSVIDEGASGLIDTVYFEHVMTARQVVDKYGEDMVSQRTLNLVKGGKEDAYVKIIQAMEPNPGAKSTKLAPDELVNKTNKPFQSIHMEADTKKVLQKDGMNLLPVFMARFRRRPGELYGRSLAMEALPTVKELNVLRRAYSLAMEKILDPPLGFYSDMLGGASSVNISAGARVQLFSTGRLPDGQMPIFQLLKINEPQVATQRILELNDLIRSKFLLDRLLDFNNKTRMTGMEAEMRGSFRNQALGNIFSRQIIEVYNPLIKWVVKILLKRKLLGLHPVKDAAQIQELQDAGQTPLVIPDAVAKLLDAGKFPFVVRFISPAARTMKADNLQGLEKLMNSALAMRNGGLSDITDNIDTDAWLREYQDVCGAPLKVMRSPDKVQQLRQIHAQQSQAALAAQQGEQQASIDDKNASAAKKYSQAGMPQFAPAVQQAMQKAQQVGMSGTPPGAPQNAA